MISYSFNLLYKVLAVALLFTVINLDYSNAQSVRLRNSDFQILNGALVIFSSIPNDAQAAVVHTNQKGEAWVLGFDLPLVRSINYPGFSTRIDTIYEKVGLQDIVLTKIPHNAPASMAHKAAIIGAKPSSKHLANTAAPKTKLPSNVMSVARIMQKLT